MAIVEPTLTLEQSAFDHGLRFLIGIDEVGRGAVAGPIAVGAAVLALPVTEFPLGLRDSKLLTALARRRMLPLVHDWLLSSAVGYATAREIDQIGISEAQSVAAVRALEVIFAQHPLPATETGLMLDGHYNWLAKGAAADLVAGTQLIFRPKLDRDSAVVAAASVVAKVERDALMAKKAEDYPHYGWERNCGYGSVAHKEAVAQHGLTIEHRISWVADWGPQTA